MADASENPPANPTERIVLDFQDYLDRRRKKARRFTVAGRPDYAYRGDYALRAALGAIGPLRMAAEALTAAAASLRRQRALVRMAQATPAQFPALFAMIRECAERLDLPAPSLFVESSPNVNAYTIATDDRAPIVVVSSGCADAMTEDELRFVLGHECGHIHNLHGVFHLMVVLTGNAALWQAGSWFALPSGVLALAQQAMRLGLAAWSRAAEITCDRAGALCVEHVDSPARALAKLAAPMLSNKYGVVDPNELVRQAMKSSKFMLRLEEAGQSHPILGKRIRAISRFLVTDVFASRRPDLATHPAALRLRDLDDETERQLASQ